MMQAHQDRPVAESLQRRFQPRQFQRFDAPFRAAPHVRVDEHRTPRTKFSSAAVLESIAAHHAGHEFSHEAGLIVIAGQAKCIGRVTVDNGKGECFL